jgi:hypothetical protein
MPRREGRRIHLDQDETLAIAEEADALAMVASLIPDPISITLYGGVEWCATQARLAVQHGKRLGLRLDGIPSDVAAQTATDDSFLSEVFSGEISAPMTLIAHTFEYRA